MFEYIKKVSVAISFISHKIDNNGVKVKNILDDLSFDLLLLAQNFKLAEYDVQDLKRLESKIAYLIDLIDFARINSYISIMNARVFVDSQIAFLKHIINLIDRKNSLLLPIYQLKEMDDFFARKNAKQDIQTKLVSKSREEVDFTNQPVSDKKENLNYHNILPNPENPTTQNTEILYDNEVFKTDTNQQKEIPKKILEESLIIPENSIHASPEAVEREIDNRRERILKSLISGGGSIKEIASRLKDLNEKTIQRDLLELMRDKKVIMLGKKRWAKYYLK